MLKRSLPVTPTTPTIPIPPRSYAACTAIPTSFHQVWSCRNHLRKKHKHSDNTMERRKREDVHDHVSLSPSTLHPIPQAGPSSPRTLPLREPWNCGTLPERAPKVRKRPAKLTLAPPPTRRSVSDSLGTRSVPSSPAIGEPSTAAHHSGLSNDREDLRDVLRGAPRRRPSVPFGLRAQPNLAPLSIPTVTTKGSRDFSAAPSTSFPRMWQDPSEHILSGNGSSLQHARSSYASGAVEVVPGLFLGDEFNARDEAWLTAHHITTVLNVAKETTLHYQEDKRAQDISLHRTAETILSCDFAHSLHLHEHSSTPTVRGLDHTSGSPPNTAATEVFYTPMSTTQPVTASPPSVSRPPSMYLRNSSSTPNLLASPQDELFVDLLGEGEGKGDIPDARPSFSPASPHRSTSSTAELFYDKSQSQSKLSPPCQPMVVTPSSSSYSKRSPSTTVTSTPSSLGSTCSIELPNDAIALQVPPNSSTQRSWPMRYFKLPWTHDGMDLASVTSVGGFATACAIIAEAIGIDPKDSQRTVPAHADNGAQRRSGNILVHCQCGVSRSATLVIAFVMQAAALRYKFSQTRHLTGMHDCYEMVKNLSSSISPNISLIYQLVEWERYLSAQVNMQLRRDGDTVRDKDVSADSVNGKETSVHGKQHDNPQRRWGNEVMDEETWLRMRAEEERKEEEEARWRTQSNAADSKASLDVPMASLQGASGVGGRRKKGSPTLNLTNSATVNADRALRDAHTSPTHPPCSSPSKESPRHNASTPSHMPRSSSASTNVFGTLRHSAAERRMKHKRTFSTEVPDWPPGRRGLSACANKSTDTELS